jgi:hypothetical protein
VPIKIDLHIVATSVDDLKEQLKKAFESLQVAPPTQVIVPVAKSAPVAKAAPVAKPVKETGCKACNGAHRAHTCKREQRKKAASFKTSEKSMKCKQCGTTETSQWRLKTKLRGPLCNACGIRHIRAKETYKKPVIDRTPEERKKERATKIRKNLKKRSKKVTKAKPAPVEPKPQPVVLPDTSDKAFVNWLQSNLGLSILRSKHFLLASKLINTWYTSIQPQETLGTWLLNEGASKMAITAGYFNQLQQANPTVFIVEDTGDNFVLVVTNPNKLNITLFQSMKWQ